MSCENRSSLQTGFGMFVLGTGIGAGLALLLAPQSGKSTRRAIRHNIEEGSEFLEGQTRHMTGKANEFLGKSAGKASELVEQGKSAINRGASSVSAAVESFGDVLRAKA